MLLPLIPLVLAVVPGIIPTGAMLLLLVLVLLPLVLCLSLLLVLGIIGLVSIAANTVNKLLFGVTAASTRHC